MKSLIALAVLPGLLILFYVYKKDTVEKEPKGLLFKLLIFGAISVIPAVFYEIFAETLLQSTFTYGMDEIALLAIENFLGIALAEELFKYLFLKWGSWKHRAFNYRFDGLVYALCVGMGFAITENIMYVVDDGFQVAVLRALTSIPGHACFAICMGIYYGEAKRMEIQGDKFSSRGFRRKALWMPVLMHGFYDFCLSVDSWVMIGVFFVYIIVTDIVIFKKIRKYSREDIAFADEVEVYDDGAVF